MKYSIIISYRDREEHLKTLLPQLKEVFKESDYEIIIAEQDNKEKFQKNSLYNIAAQNAKGDLLVFHDVDYYPSDNVSYYTDVDTPLYPVRQVVFLDENNQQRSYEDTPAGYRNFMNDVGDHSGGVFVLSKELFYKINGLNPYYKGWGMEDDDTRERLRLLGYEWKRNDEGLFYALYHKDSNPGHYDRDFQNNGRLLQNISRMLTVGYQDVTASVEVFKMEDNIQWLKISDFQYKPL